MESQSNYPKAPDQFDWEAHLPPNTGVSADTSPEMRRRTFMKAVLVGGTALAVSGSVVHQTLETIQSEHWQDEPTRIETWVNQFIHDPDLRKQHRFPRARLDSDGFGGRMGWRIAQLNMAQDNPVDSRLTIYGAFRFGKLGGIDGSSIRAVSSQYFRRYDANTVAFTARSMGTPINLQAATAATSVESMFMNSGPMDLDDARDAAAARIAVGIADLVHYDGNIDIQTIVNVYNIAREHGPAEFLFMLKDAFDLTLKSEDPEVIQAELSFLAHNDLNDIVELLKRSITSKTIAGYIFSRDPRTDLIVNPVTAYEKLKELFGKLDTDLKALVYADPGHALMEEGVTTSANYLSSMYKEINPYDSVQLRHATQMPGRADTEVPLIVSDKKIERLSRAIEAGVLPRIPRQKYKY